MTSVPSPAQALRIEVPGGVAEWRLLPWDSQQLGITAGRLERIEASGSYSEARARKMELVTSVVNHCHAARVRHLSARVDTGDLSSIHALEEGGFEMVDGILTFLLQLEGVGRPLPDGRGSVTAARGDDACAQGVLDRPETCSPATRLFQPKDMDEVLAIGRTAFVYDRFHADPALSPEVADRLNETWTRNCCLGTAADAVVVTEEEGRVASYVTCRADRERLSGVIILVATAEWARGRGAARRATLAALDWFRTQGMKSVEVGTQMRNIPASRLYESLGFRLIRTSLTFRKLL